MLRAGRKRPKFRTNLKEPACIDQGVRESTVRVVHGDYNLDMLESEVEEVLGLLQNGQTKEDTRR